MNSVSGIDFFSVPTTINVGGLLLDLSKPKVMGIMNVTPDSFFDGGRFVNEHAIVGQAEKMLTEGATFIDVGAYSTRPGADEVSEKEELRRATGAIRAIISEFPDAIISIDTFRSDVADAAIQSGARMVNDISSGTLDEKLPELTARYGLPYIAMHMRGTPQTMSKLTKYDDLVKNIVDYFHIKLNALKELGLKDILVDPGFGFAKTRAQNFELLNHLDYFGILRRPILVGMSRKSMAWKTLSTTPEHALNATTALNTIALMRGASILRVHDVKEAIEAITMVTATRSGLPSND